MLSTILFYATVVLFVLALLAWSLSEIFHMMELAMFTSILFTIGEVVLLVRMIMSIVQFGVVDGNTIALIAMNGMALFGLILNFALMRTMILPFDALVIVAIEMLSWKGFFEFSDVMGDMQDVASTVWTILTVVLAAVGVGLTVNVLVLTLTAWLRRNMDLSEVHESVREVNTAIPRVTLRNAWFAIFLLVGASSMYALWSNHLYGSYWLWTPLFAIAAGALILNALMVSLLNMCQK